MIDIPVDQALKHSAQNKHNKWPNRHGENRLEPECWPALNPKFQLKPGSRIFTIGSCFARHIERYLHQFGFHVPTIEYLTASDNDVGSEILNKYTPPSIYQDLAWTKKIRDRDDCVQMSDIEDFLITLDNGNVRDLQRGFANTFGISPERALADRKHFYQLFKQVFECETVIITLGFIECWWDARTDQYVLFDHSLRKLGDDRFFFRRLDFAESYKFIKNSLDIINSEGGKNVLITTSPVPLARTFTQDDVIIANSYSKSVLRAVAGQIAEECDNVDYFPSYENVMLTKQSYVWQPDLVHVENSFVGRIMLRVMDRYATGANERSSREEILQMTSWAAAGDWGKAHELYAQLDAAVLEHLDCGSHSMAAEICLHSGDASKANFHADRAMDLAPAAGELGLYVFQKCWEVYKALGDSGKAEDALDLFLERGKQNPVLLQWLLYYEMRGEGEGQEARLREYSRFFINRLPDDVDLNLSIVSLYRNKLMFDEAEALVRQVLQKQPRNLDFLTVLADLSMKQEKQTEACETLERMFEIEPQNAKAEALTRRWLEDEITDLTFWATLLSVLIKHKKQGKAAQILDRVSRIDPENLTALKQLGDISMGLGQYAVAERVCRRVMERAPRDRWAAVLLAKALLRMGKFPEAESQAKAALALEPSNRELAELMMAGGPPPQDA